MNLYFRGVSRMGWRSSYSLCWPLCWCSSCSCVAANARWQGRFNTIKTIWLCCLKLICLCFCCFQMFDGYENTNENWVLSLTSLSGALNGSTRTYLDGIQWVCSLLSMVVRFQFGWCGLLDFQYYAHKSHSRFSNFWIGFGFFRIRFRSGYNQCMKSLENIYKKRLKKLTKDTQNI